MPNETAPVTYEVGDRVTYTSEYERTSDDVWGRRKGKPYTVVSAYDNGDKYGVEYQCIEVTPTRNSLRSGQPDFFFADAQNLSLVAKAVYVDAATLNDPTVVTL